jgi:hypothetical protein
MQEVHLVLHQPEVLDDGAWRCRTELIGLAARPLPPAFGVDAIQAIGIAIQSADAWLQTLPEYKAQRLLYPDGSVYGVMEADPRWRPSSGS